MYEHYGFAVLPQHQGNYFFSEQIAHLEIAVSQMTPKPNFIPRNTLPFEQTVAGRVYAYLKENPAYIAYRQLGPNLGLSRKSASTAVNQLRKLGYVFEETVKGQTVMVRLKTQQVGA